MKLRQFGFFLVLIVLGLLVVRAGGKIPQFIELIRHVNIWVLLLIFPFRYGYYWANTRYYEHFFRIFRRQLTYKELFLGVISMNFLNSVLPSGGLSGAAYFAQQYSHKITARQSYIAQFFWGIATIISLVLVLAASFLILFFSNAIAQVSFRLVLILISIVLGLAIILIVMTLNTVLFKRLLFILTRPANWLLRLIKRDALEKLQINRFVDGYQDLVKLFSHSPRRAVRPFVDASFCIFCEVMSILVVFLAFGRLVNPGVIGAAYVIALMTSVVSFLTAGVGAYEAMMVAMFVALGVPFSLAFSVTTIYRLIAFWLFVPLGFYYYRNATMEKLEESAEDKV